MKKNKIITQLKNTINNPYLSALFLTSLHNLRELYSISSTTNNYNNYKILIKAINQCSSHNIKPFLNYLTLTENKLFSQLQKRQDYYNVDRHEDLLHYYFSIRISEGIKKIKLEIKKLNPLFKWEDVNRYAKYINIFFLPNKMHFNNKWLIDLCNKHQFFEIKIDLWNQEYSEHTIKNAFHSFCTSLDVNNYNLGHNKLSMYIGDFYNEYNLSVYLYNGTYMLLKKICHFTHEWAHYLDNTAYHLELEKMVNYNNLSLFYSELVSISTIIKSKHLKLYSLYAVLKRLVMNDKTSSLTKYYKFCQNYNTARQDKTYWSRMNELFARLFEVYIAHKDKNNILHNHIPYYETYEAYPKINTLQPSYKELRQFIKSIT